eukprot:3729045-Pyramimonas_sp.AAC.1
MLTAYYFAQQKYARDFQSQAKSFRVLQAHALLLPELDASGCPLDDVWSEYIAKRDYVTIVGGLGCLALSLENAKFSECVGEALDGRESVICPVPIMGTRQVVQVEIDG